MGARGLFQRRGEISVMFIVGYNGHTPTWVRYKVGVYFNPVRCFTGLIPGVGVLGYGVNGQYAYCGRTIVFIITSFVGNFVRFRRILF